MFDQMDRLYAQMRERLSRSDLGSNIMDMTWNRGMAVDVFDEDSAMMVVADLPGFEKDEIDVNIRGNILHISAEHVAESEHHHRSRSVSERVTIPSEIDENEVSASYHNGVLEICLPYETDREDAHHIDIE